MGTVVEGRWEGNMAKMTKQVSKGMDDEERLVRLFGSTSRPRILGLLLADTGKAFYQREIMYETGLSLQTVQRELHNLVTLGILKREETDARVYYQIDPTSPLFKPLKEIYHLSD
jgi:predicted transcriptional regulator